jgi:hypothetical protein
MSPTVDPSPHSNRCLASFPSLHDDFDPYHWNSPFLEKLQSSTAAFLAHVSGRQVSDMLLGTRPWQIAHFPISFGGLGFQGFSVQAVAFFL